MTEQTTSSQPARRGRPKKAQTSTPTQVEVMPGPAGIINAAEVHFTATPAIPATKAAEINHVRLQVLTELAAARLTKLNAIELHDSNIDALVTIADRLIERCVTSD